MNMPLIRDTRQPSTRSWGNRPLAFAIEPFGPSLRDLNHRKFIGAHVPLGAIVVEIQAESSLLFSFPPHQLASKLHLALLAFADDLDVHPNRSIQEALSAGLEDHLGILVGQPLYAPGLRGIPQHRRVRQRRPELPHETSEGQVA